MLSTATIVSVAAAAAWSILLPVGVLIWWRRTRKAKLTPAFLGALTFVVFAQLLEQLLHMVCILGDNPVARAIDASPWLYVLYGGLAAGVFEETGRYLTFRFLLTRRLFPERDTAVTYGVGHGGIEAIMLGVTFALYATTAALVSTGGREAALALTRGDALALSQLLTQAKALTPGVCLLNILERAAALVLQISLSVFVFLAARDRTQRSWFPFAVALHAIVDMPAAMYQKGMLPLWAVELWTVVAALYALRSARKCYLESMDP